MHLLRGGHDLAMGSALDGVETRKQALDLLRARAAATARASGSTRSAAGRSSSSPTTSKPFTREELDQVAPNNPVLLQASYREAYLNSQALQLLGINDATAQNAAIVRDAAGKPTGRVLEAGFRQLVGKLPTATRRRHRGQHAADDQRPEQAGLTAFGSAGCEADVLPTFRKLADQGQLNVRVFCITSPAGGGNSDQLLPRIAQMKLFQGDTYIDPIFYGESVFGPLHDPMFIPKSDPKPDQLATVAPHRDRDRESAPAAARAREPDEHDRRVSRPDRSRSTRNIRSRTCAGRWPTSTSSTRRTSSA